MSTEDRAGNDFARIALKVLVAVGRAIRWVAVLLWHLIRRRLDRPGARARARIQNLTPAAEEPQQPQQQKLWDFPDEDEEVYGEEAIIADESGRPTTSAAESFPTAHREIFRQIEKEAKPEGMAFEKAKTMPQMSAPGPESSADRPQPRRTTQEVEFESAQPMDRETFAKIMEHSGDEGLGSAPGGSADVPESALDQDVAVSESDIAGLFRLDQMVQITCPGNEPFVARVIHCDRAQATFLREEEAISKGSVDVGERIVAQWEDERLAEHKIHARVTNSGGADSPWFTIDLVPRSPTQKAPAGINLPFSFFVVIDAADHEEARGHVSQRTAGVMRMLGTIREINVNGMLLQTPQELPENAYLVQDEGQMGILGRLDLAGYILGCRRDLQLQNQYLSTVQFVSLSASAEQQLRALAGRRFLGNL